jgi:AraC-like DNA-binding protein
MVVRGFEPAWPRIIAAVHTQGIADTVGLVAGRTAVRICEREGQLDECLAGPFTPVILAELGAATSPVLLSRLMSGHDAPIIAMLPPGPLPISQVISLGLSGARFELVHDASELSRTIRLATAYPLLGGEIGEVVRALSWRLDRESLEDVIGLLILGRRRTTIREALARLDRTVALRTALRTRSLPTPARLLGWGAALHVIWQMERYARDIAEVARSLGFDSSRQCSDAFKFHTGFAPMNVLRGQGFEGILDEFARRLRPAADAGVLRMSLNSTDYLRICA